MDVIVLGAIGLIAIGALASSAYFLARWRRNRYRISMRSILIFFAVVGCALLAYTRFIGPMITRRWAIQDIYSAGGGVLFRDDYKQGSGSVYSDPTTSNAWGDVLFLHAQNDREAVTVARQLKHLPESKVLFLGRAVSDAGLTAICDSGKHSALETIDLCASPVTAAGLAHVAKLPQLRTLFFNSCPILDKDLASLKSLPNLRHLTFLEEAPWANPSRFTDAGFREIGQATSLESLLLVNLKISNICARHLQGLSRLKSLRIIRCQISDEAIAVLRQGLPACKIETRENAMPPGGER